MQISLDVADEIDTLAQSFPQHELYSLSSQIRRAGNSISQNIVEESTGPTNAEFGGFFTVANRSAPKQLDVYFWLTGEDILIMINLPSSVVKIETLVKMIKSLINSLND